MEARMPRHLDYHGWEVVRPRYSQETTRHLPESLLNSEPASSPSITVWYEGATYVTCPVCAAHCTAAVSSVQSVLLTAQLPYVIFLVCAADQRSTLALVTLGVDTNGGLNHMSFITFVHVELRQRRMTGQYKSYEERHELCSQPSPTPIVYGPERYCGLVKRNIFSTRWC